MDDVDEVEITFSRLSEAALQDIAAKLKGLPGVTRVEGPDLT